MLKINTILCFDPPKPQKIGRVHHLFKFMVFEPGLWPYTTFRFEILKLTESEIPSVHWLLGCPLFSGWRTKSVKKTVRLNMVSCGRFDAMAEIGIAILFPQNFVKVYWWQFLTLVWWAQTGLKSSKWSHKNGGEKRLTTCICMGLSLFCIIWTYIIVNKIPLCFLHHKLFKKNIFKKLMHKNYVPSVNNNYRNGPLVYWNGSMRSQFLYAPSRKKKN